MKKSYGWTWMIEWEPAWVLCQWVEPSKDRLMSKHKPSPEAVAVRVELVPTQKKYRDMLK
jgi:hypothetical protein